MKERSYSSYTPNVSAPTTEKKSSRAPLALLLTLILPPLGLVYLWREGVFRSRGRLVLTAFATLEMAIILALVMPSQALLMSAPVPAAPAAATAAPDDGVVTALSNIDQLLAQQQAEREAAAGITPEPTQDNTAYMAEQQAILVSTVYSVYGDTARYYHKESVCGTQSNRRALTVQEAMGLGMGACPNCNPPVYLG